MPLSSYLREKNIMELINTPSTATTTATTYLALSTTAPNADGPNVHEPDEGGADNGYVRIPVRYNIISGTQQHVANFPSSPTYDSGTDKYSITNIRDIYFYEATSSWGTITHFAIYDSLTGGNMLAYGQLTNSITPAANTIPVVRTGNLTIVEQ